MNKLIALILAMIMAMSLAACGEQPTGGSTDDGGDTVSTESGGRALYEAAMELACSGDFSGGIEAMQEAAAAEEADDWTSWDITTAWIRMAQLYRLQGDTAGEEQVKADYLAATGEELPFLSGSQFDSGYSAYFQEFPITDSSYGILVYDLDGNTMTLEEYRAAGPKDMLSSDSIRLGEAESFSFLGITPGMTRGQVYDALKMTDWARTVADNLDFVSFSFYVDVAPDTGEYSPRSFVVSSEDSDRELMYIRITEKVGDDYREGGLIVLEFENGALKSGHDGMLYLGT